MTQYVALFRGINVGGKHIVPMQDLRDVLDALDCEDVKTYVQSGNAVFSSTASADDLSAGIMKATNKRFGFEPQVLVLTADRFREIAAKNPYADRETEPKFTHIGFLISKPLDSDFGELEELRAESESYQLTDGAFYLHAPDGIGRSKLAANVDRCLGVATTGRNLRTVTKLIELLA